MRQCTKVSCRRCEANGIDISNRQRCTHRGMGLRKQSNSMDALGMSDRNNDRSTLTISPVKRRPKKQLMSV